MDLTRFLIFSAIVGGALRIANAFTAGVLAPEMLQVSYAITDLFLLMGLAAILIIWRVELELPGYLGASIAVLGLIAIRATGFTALAPSGYLIGAGIALIGVALLGTDMLWRRIGGRIAPLLWLVSFGLALWGAVGGQAALQTLAGIAFGAGFVFAGLAMLGRSEPVVQV
jgi:hypothetical protein